MNKNTDLHVHTHYSDGDYSPKEVIELASKLKIKAISITDHDTIEGLEEAKREASKKKIEAINGIEMQGLNSEILGYLFNEKDNALLSLLETHKEQRTKYVIEKIDGLNDLNIDISLEEVLEKKGPATFPLSTHIAKIMIEKGYVKDIQSAYQKYLKKIKVRLEKPPTTLKKIIHTIKNAGGVCILPHPWYLNNYIKEDLEIFLIKLKKYGLDGIESRGYIPEELKNYENKDFIKKIKNYATKYDFILSGGSDFHGEKTHPHNILGKYNVDYETIINMKKRID